MLNVVTSALCSREENKRVEFGAKVNNIQINGISFIGHHSFEAFKGIRLKQTIACQEELIGVKSGCRHGHYLCKQRKPYLLHESRYRDFPLHARNRIPRRTGHGTCGVSLGTYESPLWRDKLLWPSNIGLCHLSLLLYQLKHSILAKNGENAALTKIKGAK